MLRDSSEFKVEYACIVQVHEKLQVLYIWYSSVSKPE